MSRKILSLFTILFIISAIAVPVYADQTVFGPEDLTIGNLYVHLSSHQFSVDDPSDGVLTIVKNTPDKEIWGGFCFLNGKYIGLSNFLNRTGTIFQEDVNLHSNSRITIFLGGTPGASIKVEIKKKDLTPPPEVTFTADPTTIYVGQSSTLSWTSSHADTCVIDPGIGSVDLNGSTTVSPTETTTYTITATGLGGTATANVTVIITNSAPVANDQTVTLNEDETAPITLTASDANGDVLTYQILAGPSNGTLTGQAPNLNYTTSQNYNGRDTFTFKANDGSLDSNTATVTLSIQPVNDIPIAFDDTVTTNEDTAIAVITVLANDSDPDGDTLNIIDFTQPTHGTAGSNGDGTLTYTPDLNYNGMDSFTYTISDGNGGTATATVNITINPVNDAPVANDQAVTLNEDETASITLTATDADGDALTYQIVTGPSRGTLTGSTPDIIYTPAANYNGSDALTFKVNDGTVDSGDATVTITINPANDPPVANAGPDQTVLQGNVVTLNGSGSSDIDGDSITYNWTFISVPTGSTATLSDSSIVNPTFTANLIGTYEVQLIVNDGTIDSAPDTVTVNIVALPTVEISANPVTILTGESSTLTWTSNSADTCVIEPGVGSVALNGSTTTVSPTETTTYTITATGPGGTATASVTVTVNEPAIPPTVSFSASPATIAQGESSVLSWSSDNAQSAHIDNGVGIVDINDSTTVSPEHTTTYTITVTGSTGSASAKATVKVTGNPEPQPDGSFGEQYEDLVPSDSTVDEYDPWRFSLITGIVHAIDDSPIQDVSVTIHSHPEYGTVLTDNTGRFSIPVEGGGIITIVYQKDVLITAHRKVYVPWNDIAIAETIQMIEQDPVSTTFTFDGSLDTVITHKSTEVTDEFGSRSCSMVFTGDNSAWLVDENGNDIQQLETITVRASEFTTLDSMPAVLPPTSAYTYCVELAVDGVERVRFEDPVIIWVDNFLGFDVGIPVPLGYYDRDRGVWVPEENGIVVKLLDTDSDGIVDALDTDGDDQPDDITANGSFTDEVTGLDDNTAYTPGTTHWRVAIAHFSPQDCNWARVAAGQEAIASNAERKSSSGDEKPPCFVKGTLVKIEKGFIQIEKIAKGDFVLSRNENKNDTVLCKVVRTIVTADQKILELTFYDEAGIVESIGATAEHPFWIKNRGWVSAEELKVGDKASTFDGKWITLAESKRLAEKQTVYNIEVAESHTYFVGKNSLWVHNSCTKNIDPRKRTLDTDIDLSGTGLTLHYASNRVEGYKTYITVPASGGSVPDSLKQIVVKVEIAGRTMIQHLDPLPDQIAFFEWDGLDHLSRHVGSAPAKIHIGFVYDSLYSFSFDFTRAFAETGEIVTGVGARNEITIWLEEKITVHSKYNILKNSIAEGWTLSAHHYLDPLDTSILHKGNGETIENSSSIIYTVAGDGSVSQVAGPMGIAIDKEGNIYFAEKNYHRIRKVDKDGNITTVAGTGQAGYTGGRLNYPEDIAVDDSGNLYIADTENNGIRKLNKDGVFQPVLEPGSLSNLNSPCGVAVDISGNLYIADTGNNRIRKVDPNGFISTIAGNGTFGFSGDGGPATDAQLYGPKGIAVDIHGNLYIADEWNHRIRKVDTSGVITTVAGSGPIGTEVSYNIWGDDDYVVDNIPATEIKLYRPAGIAIDSTGSIYIASQRMYYLDYLPIFSIRKINSAGIITTIAGNGSEGFGGDGGLATAAQIGSCRGVAIDSNGSIYIAAGYNRIRRVSPVIAEDSYINDGDISFTNDPNGFVYIMSSSGRHKTTIDPETGVVLNQFDYDANNNLVSVSDQFGNQVIIERDGNGVPISFVSPDGITTSLAIDGNNHLTGITYPDGSNYSFEYTSDGLMTAIIEPEGNRFNHTYDSIGRLTNASDEEGGSWQYSIAANNSDGILAQVLSAEGNLTTYLDYTDSSGASTTTITNSDSERKVISASADGLIMNRTMPCGTEMEFEYNLDSEYLTKYVKESITTMPSSLSMITTRDKLYEDTNTDDTPDLITETVSVNDKATTLVNNVLQSEKTVTTSEGRTLTANYNPANLLTESVSIPGINAINYGYDSQGRITSISTGTRETTFSWNAQGFLESFTDPEGYTATYTHDAVGRITGVGRPDGSSLGFTYDGNGNMTVLTNPSSIQHGFGYNAVNLSSSYQTPISGIYSYVYDKDRRLTEINFPSGRQIRNVYDTVRLFQIQTPEGNIDYTYLCGTNVESITKGTEAITFGYDGKLVTSIDLTGTLNQSLGYTYNNDFNVTGFTYAGDMENYTYDNDGLLTGAGSFTITRNAQNGLPEAVNGGSLNQSRTFNGYGEQDGQVSTISGQGVGSWSLAQDDNGQITQKIETVDGITSNYDYTYDPMGRLITVTKGSSIVEEYDYDINGTRIYEMNTLRGIAARNFTYSDEDHLLTAGTTSYQYDLDGFLTTKTDGTDVTTYNYSSRGELLSATLSDGRFIEYVHDPLGRRIAKIVDGTTVEKYLWQGLTRLLAVFDGSNNLTMRFEYADGRMPVAMTRDGATYYLTYDQVGSLRVVADSAGNVVKRINYDSFGNIVGDTNPSFDMPFGFAGGLHDRDIGLVRFGYRDYDPDIGRWTAKDPIGFAGGDTDLFGYCLSNPVNRIDAVGLWIGYLVDAGVSIGINSLRLAPWLAAPLILMVAPLGDWIDPRSLSDATLPPRFQYIGDDPWSQNKWPTDPWSPNKCEGN